MGHLAVRALLASLLIGLAMAGPMMEKISLKQPHGYYVQQSKRTTPSYLKGTMMSYHTDESSPSYKPETPDYYTTPKPNSKQASYSRPSPYYKPTTPAPVYYRPANVGHESTPSHNKQPKYYSTTTAAPLVYYKEENYQDQAMPYYAPSTEASTYHQHSTDSPYHSGKIESYQPVPMSYKKPSSKYSSVSAGALHNKPTSSYSTTAAPQVYYAQPIYSTEVPVYYAEKDEIHQYSPYGDYSMAQEEYYSQHSAKYAPEMPSSYTNPQSYSAHGQEKYPNEEIDYYSMPGEHHTAPSTPAYYSAPEKEESYDKY